MLLRAGDDSSKPNAVERETAENECEEDEEEEEEEEEDKVSVGGGAVLDMESAQRRLSDTAEWLNQKFNQPWFEPEGVEVDARLRQKQEEERRAAVERGEGGGGGGGLSETGSPFGLAYGWMKRQVERDPDLASALYIGVYIGLLLFASRSLVSSYKEAVWNPAHGKLF